MARFRMTRRQFAAGLLAAGTVALGHRRAPAAVAPERIRVAVIGCRNRGWQDALAFHESGRFEIVTLCDCDTAMLDEAMKRLDGKLPRRPAHEKDFRKVLDDKRVDAVIVATPDHWHALMTVMALDAGKHVYLEKPASHNIVDGKAIVAAQRRHPDRVVAIGTQQRSGRHFVEAREFIASGGIGKVGFGRAWFTTHRQVVDIIPDGSPPPTLDYDLWLGPAPRRPYNANRLHYNWHFFRDYGTGDAGNWGAHWLDIVRWYAGLDLPRSVSAVGGRYIVKDAKEFPDTQTAIFEFPGCTVLWELRYWTSYRVNGMASGAEIGGDGGTVVIDRGGWTFHPRESKAAPVKHGGSEMELAHVKNFADCITDGARPAAGALEGHRTATLCHMANLATFLNRRLAFDPATETFKDDAEANRLSGRDYRAPWKLPAAT